MSVVCTPRDLNSLTSSERLKGGWILPFLLNMGRCGVGQVPARTFSILIMLSWSRSFVYFTSSHCLERLLRKANSQYYREFRTLFDDLPHWTFAADEVSAGVYRVTAIHDQGYRYEETGLDQDQLLEHAKDWARKFKCSRKG